MTPTILKVIFPLVLSFIIGVAVTPGFSDIMYRHRLWKRSGRGDMNENPEISPEFAALHDNTAETSTPRVGGVIIWTSVLLTIIILWIVSRVAPQTVLSGLDFLSRNQTLLPLFGLVTASLVGLGDDILQIFGQGKLFIDGLSRLERVVIVAGMALVGAIWFYTRLDVSSIHVPFVGAWSLGWLFIPFFVLVVLGTFSGGVIDGIDGLAAGVLATNFAAYGTIAFFQSQFDLAAFCAALVGAILAFLWFNIPPARFYLGETGVMGLTITLALVAFFTDNVLLLPLIALPLVATSLSVIVQRVSRKLRNGKRVFKVAPLHHHLQAIGWSSEKITMRYWVIALICSVSGIIIALIG